jgi:hypothetical protein
MQGPSGETIAMIRKREILKLTNACIKLQVKQKWCILSCNLTYDYLHSKKSQSFEIDCKQFCLDLKPVW